MIKVNFLLIIICATLSLNHRFQESTTVDIDEVIRDIFQINSTKTASRNDNDDINDICSCVQYYLCQNDTIIKDGYGIIDIRFEGICKNYLEVCCGKNDIVTEPITPKPMIEDEINYEECGIRNVNGVAGFKITGNVNNETQFGEFPWMIALLRVESYNENANDNLFVYTCGASLITPNIVLTGAHCATDKNKRQINPDKLIVRAGEWDTKTIDEVLPHQDVRIQRIIRHESFNPGNLFNDIALLFLKTPFKLDKHIRPICLPRQKVFNIFDYEDCYATGWGKDKFGQEGEYQVIMKTIDLPLMAHDLCQKQFRSTRLGPYFQLHESFICAGGEAKKDTCKGDGGGPLVCKRIDNTRYEQVGITAWGIGCGDKGIPGAYVNVALFKDWIQSRISIN